MACNHTDITLINPYELIRKYKCSKCGGVMMCECEKEFALRFFPHQITFATELDTQEIMPVTLGFQKSICNKCRSIPEVAYPTSEIHGRTSKIRRYYWREIQFETVRRFAEWLGGASYPDWLNLMFKHKNKHKEIIREVACEFQKLHEQNPKYVYTENSQEEIISKYNVDVISLFGDYRKNKGRKVSIAEGNELYSAESFGANYFIKQGYRVIYSESRPFHVLFGSLMWKLIQDPNDDMLQKGGFNRPDVKGIIWNNKPQDFGASGYYQRRKKEVSKHLATLPRDRNKLIKFFDMSLTPSLSLRHYLWANEINDIDKARAILAILPTKTTIKIMEYLVVRYWKRYCGWPDLFVYNDKEYFFSEVKSSKDKLTEDQKHWIENNSKLLHLPFNLVKIHRK